MRPQSLPSLISLMVSVDVKYHVYFTATISIGRSPLVGKCSQFVPALLVCCWISRVCVCRSDLGIVLHNYENRFKMCIDFMAVFGGPDATQCG